MSRLLGALLLAAPLLCGQLNWNSVTVTATRNAATQSAQVAFNIAVQSGADQNLGDIVAALSGTGITAANFTGMSATSVYFNNGGATREVLSWQFQLTAPLSQMKDTTAALAAAQQKLAQQPGGLSLSFSVSGNEFSSSGTCTLADLVSDARAQAQKLAGAAGLTPGAVLGLSTSAYNGAPGACALSMQFGLGLLFGQSGPNAITVSATRSSTASPDLAYIQVTVTSPPGAALDTVSAALANAGIGGATFLGMSTGNNPLASTLQWSFSWTAPLTGLKQAVASLAAAEQAIAQANTGLSLSYVVQSSQYSQAALQAQNCSQSVLLADALAQAQAVAAAAGVSVGPILNLAQGSGIGIPTAAVQNWFSAAYLLAVPYYSPPPNCSLTVQYQLLH